MQRNLKKLSSLSFAEKRKLVEKRLFHRKQKNLLAIKEKELHEITLGNFRPAFLF